MVAIHEEDYGQYELCDADVSAREIIYMFLIGQRVDWSKNFNIGIFSHTMNVINVRLCMKRLHIELYLFFTLSVTLTL